MDDIQRSWRHVDFGTGKVIFLDVTRKEDMLQVEYPNCFLLDMGWYQDRYIISVIHDFDWANPVQQYETTENKSASRAIDGGGLSCGKGIAVCCGELKEDLI